MSGRLDLFAANVVIPGHALRQYLFLFMQQIDMKSYRLVASFCGWYYTFYLAGPATPFNKEMRMGDLEKRAWRQHGKDALGWDGKEQYVQII
jgi:hypothetical protein